MQTSTEEQSSVLFCLDWRKATRLKHLLQKVKLDSCFAFVLSNGKELHQIVVSNIRGKAVPVLVHRPLTAN